MGVQPIFALHRRHVLAVAVWWYILVRFWVELFLSQDLMEAATTVSGKASTRGKSYKHNNKIKLKLE